MGSFDGQLSKATDRLGDQVSCCIFGKPKNGTQTGRRRDEEVTMACVCEVVVFKRGKQERTSLELRTPDAL
jgi:hypothetical protein